MYDILLLNCRLLRPDPQAEPDVVDIAISSGKIVEIAPYISTAAKFELDLKQKLVSPPFVESHIHLDSVLTAGQPRWNQSGTLFEGIDIWRDRKQSLDREDIKTRAIATLQQQATQGVLFARTHVDVSEPNLTALQALLEVKEEVKDWMTLQVVAFPQDGIYGSDGNEALLEKALKLGADVVGGIPHYEFTREDGLKSVQRIFELAEQYDRLIDIHCDEIDDDQSRFLEVVAAYAQRSGMGAKVTASHTTAFGSYNSAYAQKLLGLVARSQINFVANPLINITLQGRTDTYPKRRGLTRVKELWQAGINVSLGHDCIQDCWYSLGTGNMLDVASMVVHVSQMTGMTEINACYDMITWHGAKTLNVHDAYGIEVGKPANLIVLDASDRFDALRRRATVSYVIAQGQLIAKTESPKSQWQPTLDALQAETSSSDISEPDDIGITPEPASETTNPDKAIESQPIASASEGSEDIGDETIEDEGVGIAVSEERDREEDTVTDPAIEVEVEDMAIAVPDKRDIVEDEEDEEDTIADSVVEVESDRVVPKINPGEDDSLFTIIELPDRRAPQEEPGDPIEKALSQLDRMELNGSNPIYSNDDISAYSLDDLADEMPDVGDSVEKALNRLDRMELNGSKPAHSNDDISAYSLDDLADEIPDVGDSVEKALSQLDRVELSGSKAGSSDLDISAYSLGDLSSEMPDVEETGTVEEAVETSIPDLADEDEIANDPATIYSIEQLVNELFSKEV
nr:cytosine deaminase [Pseudanabaena sp. PCC 6802]